MDMPGNRKQDLQQNCKNFSSLNAKFLYQTMDV